MWTPDEIAQLCYDHFNTLPKKGKPDPGREWTLLAAVVMVTELSGGEKAEKSVISLGTGTKCIGRSTMSPKGDILNDSHAEVIARRGCVRYLTEELRRAVRGEGSQVFCRSEHTGKWKVQPGVSFLFFTSHTPCGDASIIPMTSSLSQPCHPVATNDSHHGTGYVQAREGLKRHAECQEEGTNKRLRGQNKAAEEGKVESGQPVANLDQEENAEMSQLPDVHRTGAKSVPGGPVDPHLPGAGYHSVGLLRVKPGRGEPTLSLSCSDKLARWTVLGFQGALLSHYLEGAIYFDAVVTGKCPYSQDAMKRALITRCEKVTGLPHGFSLHPPKLLQSNLEFVHSHTLTQRCHHSVQGKISPCGAAICWCAVLNQPLDVTANGYKQGVTKKAMGTPQSRSFISKVELFHLFLDLIAATPNSQIPGTLRGKQLKSYWDYKEAAEVYQQAWLQLRSQVFTLWLRSPRELLLFD
ncbi:tRNA-specific adenosine deaminase 1 [Chanos chanos]|uniref:tRNA-specific adenosine deaminase 1 n=1 Tax=Chanos chanos TaxID=29144 RepID=A0A6J2VT90_CHACN|nr:tRNA-specific adenosine deaminase 1 [Chanos chanos]